MPQTTVAQDLLTGLHPPTHFLGTPQHYAQMRGSAAEGGSVPVTKRDATVVHGQEIRLVTIEHVISINLFTYILDHVFSVIKSDGATLSHVNLFLG